MTNFIFKSQGLIKNVDNKLEMVLSELRHQRADNAFIIRQISLLLNVDKLQKQVDEFYETSPQTEQETPPEEVDHLWAYLLRLLEKDLGKPVDMSTKDYEYRIDLLILHIAKLVYTTVVQLEELNMDWQAEQ